MKMGFDSGRGKHPFARHPHVHQNYISSGRVKYLQQFCIIASFATDRDFGLSRSSEQMVRRMVAESSAIRSESGFPSTNGITQPTCSVYAAVNNTAEVWINRDRRQYGGDDTRKETELLSFLINPLLVGWTRRNAMLCMEGH